MCGATCTVRSYFFEELYLRAVYAIKIADAMKKKTESTRATSSLAIENPMKPPPPLGVRRDVMIPPGIHQKTDLRHTEKT